MSTDYAALADTIKIEDITSNNINRDILHKLKNNDESFDSLNIVDDEGGEDNDYYPIDGEDIGWLGYYIGQNTKLQELTYFYETINDESFYKEIYRNKSIKEIHFNRITVLDGDMFSMLGPFFKNNHNLNKISVDECEFGAEAARQLSLAIGNCNKSLTHFNITNNETVDGQLVQIFTALSMHPQLNHLLIGMGMGRNECMALATLCYTTNQLRVLYLKGCGINNEGLDILVKALPNSLQELCLKLNPAVTVDGWKTLSTLFELPESNLKELDVSENNNISDQVVIGFANALANNSTLKRLHLIDCDVTDEGWAPFSKLLCDTSSVNSIYLSNHTLETISGMTIYGMPVTNSIISDTESYLIMNTNRGCQNKQRVAIFKILRHHSHFNVEPFFEWEFKVLPIMISWFTSYNVRACAFIHRCEEKINKMKLSVIHDFVKEFPMLYIESVTRKEIAEYTTLEEELQGDELEEIRQCKARAMRRLF